MKKLIVLLTALFMSLNSQATLLSIELNQSEYQVGDVLIADFVISDIEDDLIGFQKLLASFEFDVSWNGLMLDYVSTSFGDKLDVDPDPFFASEQLAIDLFGQLTINETSFAFSGDLFNAQDGLGNFVLASVDFTVVGEGTDTLMLSAVDFGDDFGDSFMNISSTNKAYTVTNNLPVNVPEPSVIVLMLMGLILLVRQRKMN